MHTLQVSSLKVSTLSWVASLDSALLVSIVFKQLLHLNIVLIRFTKNICEHECGHHPSHEYHWKTQPCQTLLFPNFNLASQHRNLVSIKTMLITLARVISFLPYSDGAYRIPRPIYFSTQLKHLVQGLQFQLRPEGRSYKVWVHVILRDLLMACYVCILPSCSA